MSEVRLYRFGPFELDPRTGELRKHGRRLRLPNREARALELLLERAGEVVSREELRERMWEPGVHVEFERGVNNALHRIRETLGDWRDRVETLPRRGYRFTADVERVGGNELRRSSPFPHPGAAAILLALAAPLWLLWSSAGSLPDPSAREAELKARYFLAQKTPEALKRSLAYFDEAVRLDPELASAHAGRASAHHFLAAVGAIDRKEARARTEEAATRALSLDPDCGTAYAILAESRFRFAGERKGIEELFRRAVDLEPENAEIRQWLANFLAIEGRMEEALSEMERARKLDPLSLHINADLAALLYEAGERERAMEQFERTLELDPRYAKTHYLLGFVQLEEQRLEEAVASFERSVELSPGTPKYVAALEEALSRLSVR